jgi:hypothetical protein
MKSYKILDVISGEYITFYAGNLYFELSSIENANFWITKLCKRRNRSKNNFEIIEID